MRMMYVMLLAAALMAGGCSTEMGSRDCWERGHGGAVAASARVEAAFQRVSGAVGGIELRVRVLRTGRAVAYSFRNGDIYVSQGLVGLLTEEELAGAVAHEIGHLVRDGVVVSREPWALRGAAGGDEEKAADAVGRALLEADGIPSDALWRALEKVAGASAGEPAIVAGLRERVRVLKAMEGHRG